LTTVQKRGDARCRRLV